MGDRGVNDKLWTVEEVAAYLAVPKQTLYQWRTHQYGPPGFRIGKYVRYRSGDVMAWVETQRDAA
jgi:excisionase family DNA binding protein